MSGEHVIEAYIDVPEQDVTNGYGFPTGKKVAKFHACNRRGFPADDIDEALAQAVVAALKQWAEPIGFANKFSLSVNSKHGPPTWKIEVDRTW